VIKGILNKIFFTINEIKSQSFEIISEKEDNASGLIYLSVKIAGKCTPPMFKDPLIILRESRSKALFSEEDHDWILATLLENQKRLIEKKYKKQLVLIKHQFSEQLDEPLIVYKDQTTEQIQIKPAKEIYYNLEKIRQFNSEDSACIGNIMGCYEAEKDYRLCKEKKTNNIIKFDISLVKG